MSPARKIRSVIEYLSPIFIKEIRQGLRSDQFVWPFILVQMVAIVCIFLEYIQIPQAEHLFSFLLFLVFVIFLPLTNFFSLHSEVTDGRNIELLLMSGLSRGQVVLGKWVASNSLSTLLLISIVPYYVARHSMGNVANLTIEVLVMGFFMVLNWMANAVVIGNSAFQNHAVKIFMMLLSGACGSVSLFSQMGMFIDFDMFAGAMLLLPLFAITPIVTTLLNLKLGQAKLKLFEVESQVSSASGFIFLIIASPFVVALCLGPLGALILLIIAIRSD